MKPHLSILEHCAGPQDPTMLVARCSGVGRGNHMLMLTRRRLIVTAKSRLTRRMRVHLNLELHHLSDVSWSPEPALGGVWLAATAIDGVRERFWIEAVGAVEVHRIDKLLAEAFREPAVAAVLAA
jgi:hypothetical protein